MKKQVYYLVTIVAVFLALNSCKKTETNDPTPPAPLSVVNYALTNAYSSNVYPISPYVCENENLFITDIDGQILIYDLNFNFIDQFKDGNNKTPIGHVYQHNSLGEIFIYNHWAHELEKYDASRNFLKEIDNLPDLEDRTWAFAIGTNDDVYVLGDSIIYRYDKDLNPINQTSDISALFNHGNYGFRLSGVTCDNQGNVYVTADVQDTAGEGFDSFLKFDNALNFVGQKGGNWTLNAPRGIAVDEAGVIYIVNRSHSNIKAFDTNFELLMKTAENDDSGTSGGKMLQPYNIWYHNNLLYVTDKEAHNIVVFNKYQ